MEAGRHEVIYNSARCLRCNEVLISRHAKDEPICRCNYLCVSGGLHELVRQCVDLPGDEGPLLNYQELSLTTRTFIRKGGLMVEAYRSHRAFRAVDPAGVARQASKGHWIALEPEIGETVWTERDFFAAHVEWEPHL